MYNSWACILPQSTSTCVSIFYKGKLDMTDTLYFCTCSTCMTFHLCLKHCVHFKKLLCPLNTHTRWYYWPTCELVTAWSLLSTDIHSTQTDRQTGGLNKRDAESIWAGTGELKNLHSSNIIVHKGRRHDIQHARHKQRL